MRRGPAIVALFAFPASAVAGARRSADSLIGEQVAQSQGSRQGHQRHHVPHAGAGSSHPPAPHRLVVDVETADDLRPRQARLLLEPLKPLREVVGDLVGHSAVVDALSRLCPVLTQDGCNLPPTAMSGAVRNPRSGRHTEGRLRSQPIPEPFGRLPLGLPSACRRVAAASHASSMCAASLR